MGVASMTGFARTEGEEIGISWIWEVKSVNGKSLDLRLRLPAGFEPLEAQLRAELSRRFRRGNVAAALTVDRLGAPSIRINRELLRQLVAAVNELEGEIEAAPPRLDGLLALRGVIEATEQDSDTVVEARRSAVLGGWAAALDRLATARMEEGARLGLTLHHHLGELALLAERAAACAATQPEAIRARLRTSLAALAEAVPALPEERLAQELALLAARGDVREELDRLRAHIAQAGDLLHKGEAVGRQLDFLCQELNREANTLCSKSGDIELTRIGLGLKLAVEQFREQVQNIE